MVGAASLAMLGFVLVAVPFAVACLRLLDWIRGKVALDAGSRLHELSCFCEQLDINLRNLRLSGCSSELLWFPIA